MSCRFLVAPELSNALRAANVASANDLLDLQVDDKPRNVVTPCELPVEGTAGRFHLKRYAYPNLGRSLRMLGRGTFWGTAPEISEFLALQRLRELGVPAVRPVAAAARTRLGLLDSHALLTEHVPDAVDLAQRLADPADPLNTETELRAQVVDLLARQIAAMHHGNFVHRDLFARNVLLRVGADGPELLFLDCRRGGPPTRRHDASYDLACFVNEQSLLKGGGFEVEEVQRLQEVYRERFPPAF